MFKLPPLDNKEHNSVNINNVKSNNDGNTYFTHISAARKTLEFKTHHTYSHTDVIELLSKLDHLWQECNNQINEYIS